MWRFGWIYPQDIARGIPDAERITRHTQSCNARARVRKHSQKMTRVAVQFAVKNRRRMPWAPIHVRHRHLPSPPLYHPGVADEIGQHKSRSERQTGHQQNTSNDGSEPRASNPTEHAKVGDAQFADIAKKEKVRIQPFPLRPVAATQGPHYCSSCLRYTFASAIAAGGTNRSTSVCERRFKANSPMQSDRVIGPNFQVKLMGISCSKRGQDDTSDAGRRKS